MSTTYGYDADGNPITVTTPNGASSVNVYDHLGRLVQTIGPTVPLFDGTQHAPVTTLGYGGDGHVVTTTDALNNSTTSSYDPLGRLVSTTNPVGAQVLYTYTATTLSAVQDPAGHVTRYDHDAIGQVTAAMDPLGAQTQYGYDSVGNTIAITSPLAWPTGTGTPAPLSVETRGYDALNRVTSDTISGVNMPSSTGSQLSIYGYDHTGNLTLRQTLHSDGTPGDASGNTYDLADQLTDAAVYPDGSSPAQTEHLIYDAAGNVTSVQDFSARQHTTHFDGDDRSQQWVDSNICAGCTPGQVTTDATYDPNGDVLTLTRTEDAGNAPITSHMEYNALGWLANQDDGQGGTAYGYDAAGQLRTQTLLGGADQGLLTAARNGVGAITAITGTITDTTEASGTPTPVASSTTSKFDYTADNYLSTATLDAGTAAQAQEMREYDGDNRVLTQTVTWPGNRMVYGYAHLPTGQTTVLTTTPGLDSPQVENVGYDPLGRLGSDLDFEGMQTGFHYDDNDNLLGIDQGTPGFASPLATYNYAYSAIGAVTPTDWLPNELVSYTDPSGTTTYGYDGSGNTTTIKAPNGVVYHLGYNAEGLLDEVTQGDSSNQTLTILIGYNAQRLRSSYTVLGPGDTPAQPRFQETFRYRTTWDGQPGQLGQLAVSGSAVGTSFTETFIYRQDGLPLELLYTQGGTTTRYWYLLDGQGNVRGMLDSTGVQISTYFYDQWGQPEPGCGACEGSIHQPLRYRGYFYDGWDDSLDGSTWNNGILPWYWLSVRYYDPTLKRFLQPDPSAQDGVCSYVYAHDEPVDLVDPSGLDDEPNPNTGDGVPGTGGRVLQGRLGPVENPAYMPKTVSPEIAQELNAEGLSDASANAQGLINDPVWLLAQPPLEPTSREQPGYARGGFDLPDTDLLVRGTEGNAGKIPLRIASVLRGRWFRNFRDFRQQFWQAVAADPVLSKPFSPGNRANMALGNAPRPVPEQWYGEGTNAVVYNLHHATPISQGGGVYDLDNIYIVTPRFHPSLLDPRYHGGQ